MLNKEQKKNRIGKITGSKINELNSIFTDTSKKNYFDGESKKYAKIEELILKKNDKTFMAYKSKLWKLCFFLALEEKLGYEIDDYGFRNREQEQEHIRQLKHGSFYEKEALDKIKKEKKIIFEKDYSVIRDDLCGNLDGRAENFIVEAKCPNLYNYMREDYCDKYYLQMLFYSYLNNSKKVYFVKYIPSIDEINVKEIEYNDLDFDYLAKIITLIRETKTAIKENIKDKKFINDYYDNVFEYYNEIRNKEEIDF